MEAMSKQKKRRETRMQSVYSRCLINRKIVLPITAIGKNLKETIEENIKTNFDGKCVVEGFIRPDSVNLIPNAYSGGKIERGNNIAFEVVFECDVCFPVEGMIINCIAKNITKAGIRAESANDVPSPIVVFIAKDHHYSVAQFAEIKEGDRINVRVIGQRFELNDKYISIIGELIKEKEFIQYKSKLPSKPKIVIED
jgi:DNA-directed RNA polymerase subunit E'/Rpb7